MDIKNIPVHFTDGLQDSVPSVTQWDCGQFLKISGLNLPAACEFCFKNEQSKKLLSVAAVTEDGVTTTQIPNELLCEPYNISAFVVVTEEDSSKTVYSVDLLMRKRDAVSELPTDPNDPHYIGGLGELISSINTARDEAVQAAADAAATADTLTPADAHYDPQSWIAQSGAAVAEAIADAVSNIRYAGGYLDEALGQFLLKTQVDSQIIPDECSSDRLPSSVAVMNMLADAAPHIVWKYLCYGNDFDTALKQIDTDMINVRSHFIDNTNVDAYEKPKEPSTERLMSSYLITKLLDTKQDRYTLVADVTLQEAANTISAGIDSEQYKHFKYVFSLTTDQSSIMTVQVRSAGGTLKSFFSQAAAQYSVKSIISGEVEVVDGMGLHFNGSIAPSSAYAGNSKHTALDLWVADVTDIVAFVAKLNTSDANFLAGSRLMVYAR